ncbi:MAG: phenylalanine--tRNA ligase subunit beta, partial [Candidatus Thermoplasmatota archaeon]|nr:phenylalanine--tRNA ligase subunit beta [Candidatus Thermoplasmatota archaeon]
LWIIKFAAVDLFGLEVSGDWMVLSAAILSAAAMIGGIGRNRKKVAIGVHNAEPVQPPFTYKAVDPDSYQFVPLGKVESMTLSDILLSHEKGMAYASLLADATLYPLIVDANDNVLSFPPIINGILTEVTPFTTDLFIDVTGTDEQAVHHALAIVVTALAERGGLIYSTKIIEEDKTILSPDLSIKTRELSVDMVNTILGLQLSSDEVSSYLRKMGYETKKNDELTLSVFIPPWRADILHMIDLIEDVAVGYGYDTIESELPSSFHFGIPLSHNESFQNLRLVLIGLGFNEVTTFTLSNEQAEFEHIGKPVTTHVQIKNPIGEEYTCLRVGLISSLLQLLADNKHHSLPQKIFELGIIVDNEYTNSYHLAGLKSSATAHFTECKSIVEALFRDMGLMYDIKEYHHPGFIEGRCAQITIDQKHLGFFGELHPRTITNFTLEHPVIAFEFDVETIVEKMHNGKN